MRPGGIVVLAFSLTLLILSFAQAQEGSPVRQEIMNLEVLPAPVFQTRFGHNPDIPRTHQDILALARKLFPPQAERLRKAKAEVDRCGEYELGLLMAALQNPGVNDYTRSAVEQLMVADTPTFKPPLVIGHFRFYYTDNDPNPAHRVTLAQIHALATILNAYWGLYTGKFTMPLYHGNQKIIDVLVYDLTGKTGGTSSALNSISMDSNAVRDPCRRRTLAAHELFHRVQYRYGYVSGTADMKWMMEGTAAWAQKYTNKKMGDYLVRMNQGLAVTDRNLFTQRSYDACHFWVYLVQRTDWEAIRDIWAAYQTKGAKAAVAGVLKARLQTTFDKFVYTWSRTNYAKDLANATADFDYQEDEFNQPNPCGRTYGPLQHLKPYVKAIPQNNAAFALPGTVSAYGADYVEFPLGQNVTQVKITVTGAAEGDFSYYFLGIKDNKGLYNYQSMNREAVFTKTLKPGEWDKILLMVGGRSKGGSYAVKVGSPSDCITGTWNHASDGTYFKLVQYGTSVIGSTFHIPEGKCSNYRVSGTYNAPTLILKATKSPLPEGCCNITYTWKVTDCKTAKGTWTNSCGKSGNSPAVWKEANWSSAPVEEEGLSPECPTCPEPESP